MLSSDQIFLWFTTTRDQITVNKEKLTELDAAIGDADHGTNMDRGFTKVVERLSTCTDSGISDLLKIAGMALVSSVGGASGPLYGTFFLRASAVSSGIPSLNGDDLALLLDAGLKGIMDRGKAQPGDKTIIDVLDPTVKAYRKAIQDGNDMKRAMKYALDAAEEGLLNTIPMIAKKGRASYLGERSAGHQDPGATSMLIILKALYNTIN